MNTTMNTEISNCFLDIIKTFLNEEISLYVQTDRQESMSPLIQQFAKTF